MEENFIKEIDRKMKKAKKESIDLYSNKRQLDRCKFNNN